MDIKLNFDNVLTGGTVSLPASKSISNRVLIINALAGGRSVVENLAECDDTSAMRQVLESEGNCFDIGHAGTAMRFLTAYLSRTAGKWEITGSERMRQRPIGVLVDALNKLGADITYSGQEGYPPLSVKGTFLTGGEIEIPASVSSQYISALMMIAPYMEKGLKIILQGKVVSSTYIQMTLSIMQEFGASASWDGGVIRIAPGGYDSVPYRVESDWSAASYFYELLAIAGEGEFYLPGLKEDSLQGDAGQAVLWERLGVFSRFERQGVVIVKKPAGVEKLEYDFVEMPDLVQTFAVACCLNNIPFVFSGVETLRIKETDRIDALVKELGKLGYALKASGDNMLAWGGERNDAGEEIAIDTYHDHRMAMAFAPAALKFPGLIIRDKEVVSKSFPGYWEQLFHFFG